MLHSSGKEGWASMVQGGALEGGNARGTVWGGESAQTWHKLREHRRREAEEVAWAKKCASLLLLFLLWIPKITL